MEEYRNHTFQAECKILRELMEAPEEIPSTRQVLRAEMFQDSHAREVWKTLCDTFDAGSVIDVVTLYGRAPEKNWYQDQILGLTPSCSPMVIQEYAAAIRSGYDSLKVLELAERLRVEAARGTTAPEALAILHEYEEEATAAADAGRVRSLSDTFNELLNELQAARGCVATGFPSLDLATYGGFEAGNLVIIAARPSVGKTALALHLARTMAEDGKRVLFFSLEMTATELTKRLCLGTGRVRAKDFRREAPNWQSIEDAGKTFDKLQVFVDDTSRRLEDIRAALVLENSRRGLDVAFVDYLGLVQSGKDERIPQYLKIAAITGQLKQLAKELQIPVILLCQLNRDAAKEDRDPELYDLRDSGAIEQDADIVIMLDTENEESRRLTAFVKKNRNGRRNFSFELETNETHTQFKEIEQL